MKTYEILERKGNYREVTDKEERVEAIKAEMTAVAIEAYHKNLLLVSTNRDRKEYNEKIRAEYVKRKELEQGRSFQVTVHNVDKKVQESRKFAEKERIIFTANDKRLGVMNGTMATIEEIQGEKITARTDSGEQITWSMEKYNSIDYGYAVTNYKAQGMTVDKVVADMNTKGAVQTRNALYVDISRARKNAVVYTDDKAKLERQTREFAVKVTSRDFEKKLEAMRLRGGIRNNDCYKALADPAKVLEKALVEIAKHMKPPAIVQEWIRRAEMKREDKPVAKVVVEQKVVEEAKPEVKIEEKSAVKKHLYKAKVTPKPKEFSR